MKKLLISFIFLIALQAYGQEISTTTEEYNYLTVGYPESIEKGTDLKQGYTLTKINTKSWSGMTLELFSFSDLTGKVRAYLLTRKMNDKKKVKYFCLPVNNLELRKKYAYETSNEDEPHKFKTILADLLIDSLHKK